MRVQLAATVATYGNQTDIVIPFKTAPGIAENNIGKSSGLVDQAVYLFALMEASRKMILSCIERISKHGDWVAGGQISNKALLIKK